MDIPDDARAVVADNPDASVSYTRLAKLQKRHRNVERDFHRMTEKDFGHLQLEPLLIKDVPHLHRTRPGIELMDVYIQSPHEAVASYFNEHLDMFDHCFLGGNTMPESRLEYWHHAEDTDWFQRCEFKDDIRNNPASFVPLRLWHDDIAVTKKRALAVQSVRSKRTILLHPGFPDVLFFSSKLP